MPPLIFNPVIPDKGHDAVKVSLTGRCTANQSLHVIALFTAGWDPWATVLAKNAIN